MELAVLALWLDSMTLVAFRNLNNSVIYLNISKALKKIHSHKVGGKGILGMNMR